MLESERVKLRPIRRKDIELLLKWFNDQEVTRYLSTYLPMTEMAEEKWIEELGNEQKEKKVVFIIEVKGKNNKPIGNCGLHEINHKNQEATFGIAIGEKEYQSRGYGSEAARLLIEYGFSQLNLNRISSAAFKFNERSRNLHKKLGFKEEGCQREIFFRNGNFQDGIMFGLLRKEWKEKDSSK